MQDAQPAVVLNSKAAKAGSMDDASRNPGVETDEQLMVEFSRGLTDSFSALFKRYQQPLFGFFYRRVADPALAEELTQETFLAVLRAAPRYRQSALFRTWLYAIGFKILRAYRRKAAFRATFLGAPHADCEPATQSTIEVDVLMRHAVGKLERLDREVLMLREFEQLSYAEIAALLHLPLNTVRSRLFRARMALHGLLTAPAPQSSAQNLAPSPAQSEERI